MPSPYSFKENILWLFKHISPDTDNSENISLSYPSYKNENLSTSSSMKILFMGDLMSMYFEKVPKCCYNAQSLFQKADYIIANLEAPITKEKKGSGWITNFVFEFSEDYLLEFFQNFSIEPEKMIFTLGNNHISDHGINGFERTNKFTEKTGVKTVGHYKHSPLPLILSSSDLSVLIYSWSEWMNFPDLPDHDRVCRNKDILSMPKLTNLDETGKSKINIGLPHWGYEFRHFPNKQNNRLKEQFFDLGFDFLLGHHPHVLGPFESMEEGEKFCFHSLGNFTGIQLTWPTKLTGIFELNLVNQGPNAGRVKSYHFHPYYHGKFNNQYQLLDLDKLPKPLQNKCINRLKLLYGEKFD